MTDIQVIGLRNCWDPTHLRYDTPGRSALRDAEAPLLYSPRMKASVSELAKLSRSTLSELDDIVLTHINVEK